LSWEKIKQLRKKTGKSTTKNRTIKINRKPNKIQRKNIGCKMYFFKEELRKSA